MLLVELKFKLYDLMIVFLDQKGIFGQIWENFKLGKNLNLRIYNTQFIFFRFFYIFLELLWKILSFLSKIFRIFVLRDQTLKIRKKSPIMRQRLDELTPKRLSV